MDLFVLSIDQFFDNNMVLGFIDDYNIHYPSVSGTQGGGSQVFEDFAIPYTPALILIAPDHSIVEQHIPHYNNNAQFFIDLIESYNVSISGVSSSGKMSLDMKMYPNPTDHYLSLILDDNAQINNLKIFQLTGQEVISNTPSIKSNKIQVDVSDLQKGLFLLTVELDSGERISKTFVKN